MIVFPKRSWGENTDPAVGSLLRCTSFEQRIGEEVWTGGSWGPPGTPSVQPPPHSPPPSQTPVCTHDAQLQIQSCFATLHLVLNCLLLLKSERQNRSWLTLRGPSLSVDNVCLTSICWISVLCVRLGMELSRCVAPVIPFNPHNEPMKLVLWSPLYKWRNWCSKPVS